MKATEFVASYFAAWNRQDARAIAEHLSEHGVYADIPSRQHLLRDDLITQLDAQFAEENRCYALVGEVLASAHSVAFQYRSWPRNTAPDEPGADVWYGAEFITLRDGAATEISDYYEARGAASPPSPDTGAAPAGRVKRYAKSGLTPAQMQQVMAQLTALMESERTYLQPNLTLPELAEALGSTVNHVSQAINAGFGISFFDYLNRYRVQRAMELLCSERDTTATVLSVALDVGFSSTSTFYVAFKKVTGQTPAEFRRSQQG